MAQDCSDILERSTGRQYELREGGKTREHEAVRYFARGSRSNAPWNSIGWNRRSLWQPMENPGTGLISQAGHWARERSGRRKRLKLEYFKQMSVYERVPAEMAKHGGHTAVGA